jgi:hypothetical protein
MPRSAANPSAQCRAEQSGVAKRPQRPHPFSKKWLTSWIMARLEFEKGVSS